ncbi:MAG TPA: glycosyltransferase family 4 protein [Chloroflexota bacterium]|nr:glycosyltransferase family 4 protein [Chloroflexota bacterium]
MSSFPPRECGLATFTADVKTAVDRANPGGCSWVMAMDVPHQRHAYPRSVRLQIAREDRLQYVEAARFVNDMDCDLVNVQHEYGLFGGVYGSYLLDFINVVQRPVVLTLHTTLPDPPQELRTITRELVAASAETVVLARTAVDILQRDYGIPAEQLHFIPHGVPNVRLLPTQAAKRALGIADRRVIVTCGLINPGKGIEYAIEGVAGLVKEFPDVLYLVVGETHPGVRAESGEAYRESLQARVHELGLDNHVRFVNRYLRYRELVLYLLASDVYMVPYLNLDQIVSGTLAYALGCGRAIVSTPSIYAREVLADGRGVLVPPRSAEAIATMTAGLLRHDGWRTRMQQAAYDLGHGMIWPNVARRYLEVYELAVERTRQRDELVREYLPPKVSLPIEPSELEHVFVR